MHRIPQLSPRQSISVSVTMEISNGMDNSPLRLLGIGSRCPHSSSRSGGTDSGPHGTDAAGHDPSVRLLLATATQPQVACYHPPSHTGCAVTRADRSMKTAGAASRRRRSKCWVRFRGPPGPTRRHRQHTVTSPRQCVTARRTPDAGERPAGHRPGNSSRGASESPPIRKPGPTCDGVPPRREFR